MPIQGIPEVLKSDSFFLVHKSYYLVQQKLVRTGQNITSGVFRGSVQVRCRN